MSLNELSNAGPTSPSANNPNFPSSLNPQTPRTLAFNRLGGTKDLPLRNHFHSSNQASSSIDANPTSASAPKSPNFSTRFALRSPTFPGSPLSPGFDSAERKVDEEMAAGRSSNTAAAAGSAGMYFPPPPKVAVKGGK